MCRGSISYAEETQPKLAREGGVFIGAIYGAEEEAQRLARSGEALRKHQLDQWLRANAQPGKH